MLNNDDTILMINFNNYLLVFYLLNFKFTSQVMSIYTRVTGVHRFRFRTSDSDEIRVA